MTIFRYLCRMKRLLDILDKAATICLLVLVGLLILIGVMFQELVEEQNLEAWCAVMGVTLVLILAFTFLPLPVALCITIAGVIAVLAIAALVLPIIAWGIGDYRRWEQECPWEDSALNPEHLSREEWERRSDEFEKGWIDAVQRSKCQQNGSEARLGTVEGQEFETETS